MLPNVASFALPAFRRESGEARRLKGVFRRGRRAVRLVEKDVKVP